MASSERDYYSLLGVEKTASFIAIRRAYLLKFKEFQPDKHPEEREKYEKLLAELLQAYEVLCDEEKRKLYDQYGPSLQSQSRDSDKFPSSNTFRSQSYVRARARGIGLNKAQTRAGYHATSRALPQRGAVRRATRARATQENLICSRLKCASRGVRFSVGGAKDVGNFREKIAKGYLPKVTDVTYEGLFYDYFFDTGKEDESTDEKEKETQKETTQEASKEERKEEGSGGGKDIKLFSPDYSAAMRKGEYYMTVGLNSDIQESDLKRFPLNIVICLDISGSMTDTFQSDNVRKAKIDVAKEAIVGLLTHLNKEDRVGFVVFNTQGILYESLGYATPAKKRSLKKQLQNVRANGGTNFEAGYKTSTLLFTPTILMHSSEYENRMIFLTDAMPNLGRRSKDDLFELTEDNASIDLKIHTTFIGVGLDFNSELIEHISKVRGCNYYSVNSSEEFIQRMDKQFVFMVTPLVFNVKLEFESKEYALHAIYGSGEKSGSEPQSMEGRGELMKICTLFPTATDEETGEAKGGIVLVQLKKRSEEETSGMDTEGQETKETEEMELIASYEDRNAKKFESVQKLSLFEQKSEDFFDNNGIRKGIILVKYVQLLHDIIASQSDIKLRGEHKHNMERFMGEFENEMQAIGDDTMAQEVKVMKAFLQS